MSAPRRLSARRGSITAPDPFGVYADVNLNPNRSSSSILTIVRVPSATPTGPPVSQHEPPSPVLTQRRLHRRIGGQPSPSGPPTPPAENRVSFAFSSFGGGGQRSSSPGGAGSREHPPSPSSSPRLRPSSPHLSASSYGGKPRLTPDQLVDLARQATNPRLQSIQGPSPPPGASSPGIAHYSPVLRPQALPAVAPATFTPLPHDIYLPFIDRPSEVNSLISSPPDAKLFTLLAQTFRIKQPAHESSSLALVDEPLELPHDPTHWTYQQLIYHLTRIDRDIAPDFIWAIAARKCILSHSELIWERIKGALGVPPELDVDCDFLEDDQSSPDTSDISDDDGKGAKGHWSDWDAVMDSPISARNLKRLSSESTVASVYSTRHEAHFRSQMDEKLQGLQQGFVQSSSTELNVHEASDATIVPSPHGENALSPPEEGMVIGSFSPPHIVHHDATPIDGVSPDFISIEPLLAPPTSKSLSPLSNNPPPPGDGLGDIAEGAEEEEEAEAEATTQDSTATTEATLSPPEDPNLISPSQIQGLRISTSPLPASNSFGTPPILSPISPLPPYPYVVSSTGALGTSPAHIQAQPQLIPSSDSFSSSHRHSRTSSVSSIGPFQRSESIGNLSASWSAAAAVATTGVASGGGGSQYAVSVVGSDAGDSSGYYSDGDRLPGHPLFPSNFARLNVGPSLRANYPATRSSHGVPHARYVSNSTFSGPSLANRPGKVRAYSHGASTSGLRPGMVKRQSWGTGAGVGGAEVAAK